MYLSAMGYHQGKWIRPGHGYMNLYCPQPLKGSIEDFLFQRLFSIDRKFFVILRRDGSGLKNVLLSIVPIIVFYILLILLHR